MSHSLATQISNIIDISEESLGRIESAEATMEAMRLEIRKEMALISKAYKEALIEHINKEQDEGAYYQVQDPEQDDLSLLKPQMDFFKWKGYVVVGLHRWDAQSRFSEHDLILLDTSPLKFSALLSGIVPLKGSVQIRCIRSGFQSIDNHYKFLINGSELRLDDNFNSRSATLTEESLKELVEWLEGE